jgi:hypothetical protein
MYFESVVGTDYDRFLYLMYQQLIVDTYAKLPEDYYQQLLAYGEDEIITKYLEYFLENCLVDPQEALGKFLTAAACLAAHTNILRYDVCEYIQIFLNNGATLRPLTHLLVDPYESIEELRVMQEVVVAKMQIVDHFFREMDSDYIRSLIPDWNSLVPMHISRIPDKECPKMATLMFMVTLSDFMRSFGSSSRDHLLSPQERAIKKFRVNSFFKNGVDKWLGIPLPR